MDGAAVSRIERWTRRVLEIEASKRGVQQPEQKASGALIAAIVQPGAGLQSARKVVRSWVKSASAVLPRFGKKLARDSLHAPASRERAALPGPSLAPAPQPQPTAAQPMAATTQLRQQRNAAELKLFWQVSQQAADGAQKLLAGPGELALRVVAVRADATQIVTSEITDHGPIPPSGEWHMVLPSADAHIVSAVGMRHGERFVSIAHESSRATR
jgi:hypothetical protein